MFNGFLQVFVLPLKHLIMALKGWGLLKPRILSWVKAFGVFVASDHCELFLEGLRSLRPRMQATSSTALAAARHLEAHPKVNRVMYATLESHPTYSIARRYLELGPGCIWFHVSGKKAQLQKLLAAGPLEYKPDGQEGTHHIVFLSVSYCVSYRRRIQIDPKYPNLSIIPVELT